MADFANIDEIQLRMLDEVADLHQVPAGAYNIRANGKMADRASTANIEIVSKDDGSGIDVRIKPGTRHESVHIPVVLSESGLHEVVYNDFYIGDERVGTLKREFTFLSPAYDLDCCGWRVTGNWLEWDYQILRRDGSTAAVIRKELFHWTDTYTIETEYDEDALCALMVVLAIDADKCGSA